MKKIKIVLMILAINSISYLLNAQNDTTIVISEEVSHESDYNYKQKYKYLDINMKNEKTLFKTNFKSSIHHARLQAPKSMVFRTLFNC